LRRGDDLSLITAVHESFFTWDGNAVWAAARPFPAQQQVEDHGPPSWASVVLNQAELVILRIGHNDDAPSSYSCRSPVKRPPREVTTLIASLMSSTVTSRWIRTLPVFGWVTGWNISRGWGSSRLPR